LSKNWLSTPWYSYADGDDGTDWLRFTDSKAGRTVHQFERPLAYIAFSIPYVRRQRSRLFKDLQAAAATTAAPTAATVTEFVLATSEAGHAVSGVNISSANWSGGPTRSHKERVLIWFQARQHAWESGSSWT
jgi:hypothetical protein